MSRNLSPGSTHPSRSLSRSRGRLIKRFGRGQCEWDSADPLLVREVLDGIDDGNRNLPFAGRSSSQKSPLTDSNRRPPPYHGDSALDNARPTRFHRALSPANSIVQSRGDPFPSRALNLPEKPRTCPQNLSPRSPRRLRCTVAGFLRRGLEPS